MLPADQPVSHRVANAAKALCRLRFINPYMIFPSMAVPVFPQLQLIFLD